MSDELKVKLGVELDESNLNNIQSKIENLKGGKNGSKINLTLDKNINSQISNLKRSLNSVTNKPYKLKFEIDQNIRSDIKSLIDDLNKAASNFAKYGGRSGVGRSGVGDSSFPAWNKVPGSKQVRDELQTRVDEYIKDLTQKGAQKIRSQVVATYDKDGTPNYKGIVEYQLELGKTKKEIMELDKATNVWRVHSTTITSDLGTQTKELDKFNKAITEQENKIADLESKAFKQNNPLTGTFEQTARASIEAWKAELNSIKNTGNQITSQQENALKRLEAEANRVVREQRFAEHGGSDLVPDDISTRVTSAYNGLDIQIQKLRQMGLYTDEVKTSFDGLKDSLGRVQDTNSFNQWKDSLKQVNEELKLLENSAQGKGLKLALGIDENEIEKLKSLASNDIISSGTTDGITTLRKNITELLSDYQRISAQLKDDNLTDSQFKSLSLQLDELKNKFTQVSSAAKVYQDGLKNNQSMEKFKEDQKILLLQLDRVQEKYNQIKATNKDKADPVLESQLNALKTKIENVDPTNIGLVRKELQEVRTAVNGLAPPMQSFSQILSQSFGGVGQYLSRFVSTVYLISKAASTVKKMVSEVRELDTSLVELQKVTSLEGEALGQFTEKAYNAGRELGRTGKDVIDATTTFSRAGYDLEEAMQLSKSALVMTNVGVDIPSVDSAASDMISILKAFDKQADESMSVIDKLYNVANKEPLDFGNITQMLVTAGGTLSQTNTTLEQTMGLLTGAFTTLRDTSVANGLVMISQRLRGVKEDGEEIGDGFMPKLKKALGDVGIDIEDQNKELRSTYDILNDLAGVWDQLNSKQRQYIGEKVAGNRQVKTLNAIMMNWDVVQDTIQKADEAQGAALEGNEKYMDSIEGRITRLKSAFQELATSTISSDLVKTLVSFGAQTIEITSSSELLVPVLQTIIGLVMSFKSLNIANGLGKIGNAIKSAFVPLKDSENRLQTFTSRVGLAIAALSVLSTVYNKIKSANDPFTILSKAKQEYEDSANKISNLKDKIQSVDEQITQLESHGDLTFVQQQELDRLKLVSQELQKQCELEETLQSLRGKESEKAFVSLMGGFNYGRIDNNGTITNAELMLETTLRSVAGFGGAISDLFGKDGKQTQKDIEKIFDVESHVPDDQKFIQAYNQIYEYQKTRYELIQKIADSIASGEDVANLSDLTNQLDELDSNAPIEATVQLGEIYSKYLEASKNIPRNANTEEAFKVLDWMGQSYEAIQESESNLKTFDKYNFDNLLKSDKYKTFREALTEQIGAGPISLEDLIQIEGADAFLNDLKKLQITASDAVAWINEAQQKVESGGKHGIYGFMFGDTGEEKLYSTTEAFKTLTTALTEQQKAGVLSSETWQKIITEFPELQKSLKLTANGYRLNVEAVQDYIRAQDEDKRTQYLREIYDRQEAIKRLRDKQGELTEEELDEINSLENQISQYSALVNEIDSATDALARYQNAMNTKNQDADFNIGQKAFKTFKENLEIGKVGTDDFKTAMDFLLGPNWKEKFEGDVDAAYKAATKVGERYFGGKDERDNIDKFINDLEKSGFGETDKSGTFKLFDKNALDNSEVTIGNIAEKLGISAEAAKSLFGLIEAYGGEFDISHLITGEELDKIQDLDAKEAEKTIEELNKQADELQKKMDTLAPDSTEYENTKKELEKTEQAANILSESIEKAGESTKQLTLEEAIAKLEELKNTINTITSHEIDVPVVLSREYEQTEALIQKLQDGVQGNVTVNADGNARGEVASLNEEIELVPDETTTLFKGEKDSSVDTVEQELNDTARDRTVNYKIGTIEVPDEDNPGQTKTVHTVDNTKVNEDGQVVGFSGVIQGYDANNEVDHLTVEDMEVTSPPSQDWMKEPAPQNSEDLVTGNDTVPQYLFDQVFDNEPLDVNVVDSEVEENPYDKLSEMDLIGFNLARKKAIESGDQSWFSRGGYVDLANRPTISSNKLIEKGWDTVSDQIATVFSSTGRIGENGEIGVVVTPIMPNGDVIDPDTFFNALENMIVGPDGKIELPEGDWGFDISDILISSIDLSKIQDLSPELYDAWMSVYADTLHKVQDALYGEQEPITAPVSATPEPTSEQPQASGQTISVPVSAKNPENVTEEVQSAADSSPVDITTQLSDDELNSLTGHIIDIGFSAGDNASDELSNVIDALNKLKEAQNNLDNVDINDPVAVISASQGLSDAAGNFVTAYNELSTKLGSMPDVVVDANTASAMSKIQTLQVEAGRTVTMPVQIQTIGALPTFASGTHNAPESMSLVDEKGAELIEHTKQGTFELGTNRGPRFTNLEKGDVVHTASETRSILNRLGRVGGFFRDGLNQDGSIIGRAFAIGGTIKKIFNLASTKISGSFSKTKTSSSSKSSKKSSKSSKSSSKKSSKSKFTDWASNLFDWAEVRLERLQELTDNWVANAVEAIGYASKNAELSKALDNTAVQIDNTRQAYDLYIKQADAVQKKAGLSADIVKKIQDGEIEISSYSKDMQEKINEYKKWYDKAVDCSKALHELKEQEQELAKSKLDNILNHYDYRIKQLDSVVSKRESEINLLTAQGREMEASEYSVSIDATNKKLEQLLAQRSALNQELADLVSKGTIQEESEIWYEYNEKLDEISKTINETKTAIIELHDTANDVSLTKLGYQLDELTNKASRMDEMIRLHGAQAIQETDDAYVNLINNGMDQIKNLEEQNRQLREQQEGLDVLSQKYQDLESQIQQNISSINQMKASQEGWNDSILDLKIDQLNKYKEGLTKTNEQYEKQKQLQEAIERMQKAQSQRTQRTYIEGTGFVYQADQEEILAAQKDLENIIEDQLLSKIDDLVQALEYQKDNLNVYDAEGNLLGSQYTIPQLGTLSSIMSQYYASNVVPSISGLKGSLYDQIVSGATGNNSSMEFNFGDINLSEVSDVNTLGQAIVDLLPNAVLQALSKKY